MTRTLGLLALALLAGTAPAQVAGITVDKDKKAVIVDAKMAPRKIADPKFEGKIYPIEVIASYAYPKGQKAHETVVTIEVKPSDVHKALESLGLKPGKPIKGNVKGESEGPELNVLLEVPTPEGDTKRLSMDKVLMDPRTGKPLPKTVKWRFTGSVMTKPDPNKPEMAYGADLTGTLIAVYPVTDETVMQSSLTMAEEKFLKLETNAKALPKEGTAVKLIFEVVNK